MKNRYRTFVRILTAPIPVRKWRKTLRNRLLAIPINRRGKQAAEKVKCYLHVLDASGPVCRPQESAQLPIWQAWLQGEENAPDIVKKCLASVKYHCPDRTINLVTEENYENYISMPAHVVDKYRAGIISKIHFSDVLRLLLLQRYGGTWIDATILLTGRIPQYILEQPYFVFKNLRIEKNNPPTGALWFIHAQPEHTLIKNIARMLCEYWLHENALHHYFIYNILEACMLEHNQVLRAIWEDAPRCPEDTSLLLKRKYWSPFNEATLKNIISLGPIHKLSYKYKAVPPGSFLEYFLRNDNYWL